VELKEEKLPAGAVKEAVRRAEPVEAEARREGERREGVPLVQPERRYAEGERLEGMRLEGERREGERFEGERFEAAPRTVGERLAGEAPRGERYEPVAAAGERERYEPAERYEPTAAAKERGYEGKEREERGAERVGAERIGGEHIAVRETAPTEFARGAAAERVGAEAGAVREAEPPRAVEREGAAVRPSAAKVTYVTSEPARREGAAYGEKAVSAEKEKEALEGEEERPAHHKGMLGKMSERVGEAAHKVGAKLRGEE
jgi:hypothetical protein